MKNLLWKQWHEHKLYLAIFVAWMILAAGYAVGYEAGHRFHAIAGHLSSLSLFYSWFAAVFLAMRTACGERTDGTLSFSAALPISMRQMAAIRLAGAAVTLAVPILLAAVLISIALAGGLVEQGVARIPGVGPLPQREIASLLAALEQVWSVAAIAIFGGIELLLLHAFLYSLAVLGTCWLRQPVIGGFLAILIFAVLTIAIEAFPATQSLDPMHVFNGLLDAERSSQVDFTQHRYPLVYGSLSVAIVMLSLLASRLARPFQPTSRWFRPISV